MGLFGQRLDLNWDKIAMVNLTDPTENSEAGKVFQRQLQSRFPVQAEIQAGLRNSVSTSHWMQAALEMGHIALGKAAISPGGGGKRGINLAVNSQQPTIRQILKADPHSTKHQLQLTPCATQTYLLQRADSLYLEKNFVILVDLFSWSDSEKEGEWNKVELKTMSGIYFPFFQYLLQSHQPLVQHLCWFKQFTVQGELDPNS